MVVLALLFCPLPWVDLSHSQEVDLWGDDPFTYYQDQPDQKEESFDPDAPEVHEPFFAMILQWAADDSLGTWTGSDVLAFSEKFGRTSRFPTEQLVSFSRYRPGVEDSLAWPGVDIRAVWEIELNGPQDPAMPYSIFGYHPGTLRVSGALRLAETSLGAMGLRSEDGSISVTEIQVFRLELGTVVLDVDGWLDALMGKKLDDAAVIGFVTAREQGRLVSLAVSIGDEGRHIYGEFDLKQDKVLPNGRAVMSALSAACRTILTRGQDNPLDRAWEGP